ncbi:MAG: Ca2+-dependent phosphoinositide-specific phospholipase C, partial [Aestuariibaculum sp.]
QTDKTIEIPVEAKHLNNLKINQIQVLGTHNSYARPVDSQVIKYAAPKIEKLMGQFFKKMPESMKKSFKENHPNGIAISEGLNYDHPTFKQQLNAGLRNLEIDVYHDSIGGIFSNPASYRDLKKQGAKNLAFHNTKGLETPGFKVLHMADYDFRSHYPTLKDALVALKEWSSANPNHIPIYIQLEVKDMGIPVFENPTRIEKFTKDTYNKLDEEIISVLGKDKLITPDIVKSGYTTLNKAIHNNNWPTVKEARGKFIFLMLPGSAGTVNESDYTKDHPNLEGRAMFVTSDPKSDHAAFLLLDNAIDRQDDIKRYVKEGYLVRTRSDIETYEAKINDKTRANMAFSSGAQVVSTDFYKSGNVYNTSYFVTLPGGGVARKNPVNGEPK